jgi:endoglycosylceramidase
MEQHFRSWTYWQFKYYHDITTAARPGTTESFYDENGQLQATKVKALARPYAYAICGKPISQNFNKGVLKLTWIAGECYNMNTELFLSENYYFPVGKSVTFSKNCKDCELRLMKGETFDFY